MKHPEELDLHDLDKMEIDRLEQEVLTLTYCLEHAQDRLAEVESALTEATFELERIKCICPYGCQEEVK